MPLTRCTQLNKARASVELLPVHAAFMMPTSAVAIRKSRRAANPAVLLREEWVHIPGREATSEDQVPVGQDGRDGRSAGQGLGWQVLGEARVQLRTFGKLDPRSSSGAQSCRRSEGSGSLPFANGWELCEVRVGGHARTCRPCRRSIAALVRDAAGDRQGHWMFSDIAGKPGLPIDPFLTP